MSVGGKCGIQFVTTAVIAINRITDQELASADERQLLPGLIHLIYIAHLKKKHKYLNKRVKTTLESNVKIQLKTVHMDETPFKDEI